MFGRPKDRSAVLTVESEHATDVINAIKAIDGPGPAALATWAQQQLATGIVQDLQYLEASPDAETRDATTPGKFVFHLPDGIRKSYLGEFQRVLGNAVTTFDDVVTKQLALLQESGAVSAEQAAPVLAALNAGGKTTAWNVGDHNGQFVSPTQNNSAAISTDKVDAGKVKLTFTSEHVQKMITAVDSVLSARDDDVLMDRPEISAGSEAAVNLKKDIIEALTKTGIKVDVLSPEPHRMTFAMDKPMTETQQTAFTAAVGKALDRFDATMNAIGTLWSKEGSDPEDLMRVNDEELSSLQIATKVDQRRGFWVATQQTDTGLTKVGHAAIDNPAYTQEATQSAQLAPTTPSVGAQL